VRARLAGLVPFDKIEDRTRTFLAGDFPFVSPEDFTTELFTHFKRAPESYEVPYWMFQPKYVEVWLEKDALSALFWRVCKKHHVILAPCRGYPSLTFLYDAAMRLRNIDKPITILYFGDLDPRGEDIQRYLTETLRGFGVVVNVQRIALTELQVLEHRLPPAPTKKKDTLARQWVENLGDATWELDALEPRLLMQLAEESILKHFDQALFEKRNELQRQCREKANEVVGKLLRGDL
jgi:hypothetical protein